MTRRDFLKLAALGAGSFSLRALPRWLPLPEFPAAGRLGRVCAARVEVTAKPNSESQKVGELPEDTVVPWIREVAGSRRLWYTQRYVETPGGYIYSPNLQPVLNQPNQPLSTLPDPAGMWVEVTVPYVDLVLSNPPARSSWVKNNPTPRFYYSQVLWADQIKSEQGQVLYHIKERYGSPGDEFWAAAQAFRPLTAGEISPLSPNVEDKRVVVNLTRQTMSCYEGNVETYFCRISSGVKLDDKWATPQGAHTIWRKLVSVHMQGGAIGEGYDLAGIAWTTLFSTNGVAVHSTFWHNNFGVEMSHGCINARPEDAKHVFRWTLPSVAYEPGDNTTEGQKATKVVVVPA